MDTKRWHLLTGEYPPQPGGVADYSHQLTEALQAAGASVDVWAPELVPPPTVPDAPAVHRLRTLCVPWGMRALDATLRRHPESARLLVQYVPHSLGWRGLNLPFATWLLTLPRALEVWTMFHEVVFPFRPHAPLRHQALALVTHASAALAVRRSDVLLCSTEAWVPRLRRLGAPADAVEVLPVPSNLPGQVDAAAVAGRRQKALGTGGFLVGHFGTYPPLIRELLFPALARILELEPRARFLFVGRHAPEAAEAAARAFPGMGPVLTAVREPESRACAESLVACDLLLQPFPDGATTRRGSLMAGLSLGCPTVTNAGALSERFWADSGAVCWVDAPAPDRLGEAAVELLHLPSERAALGQLGAALYRARFSLESTVQRLLARAAGCADRVMG